MNATQPFRLAPRTAAPDSPRPPFADFANGPMHRPPLREAITAAWRRPEPEAVRALIETATLPAATQAAAQALAAQLAGALRQRKPATGRAGLVQGLLQEYALSSQEGVALMCLAEALLRIPDAATRDALIRDKIAQGQWQAHLGQSPSLFVNAASWGLLLTGKLVATHSESGLGAALGTLIRKGGEPLIRLGVDRAMRLMGEQFVTGETIGQALRHAQTWEARGFRYSYDMLGEAALTAADAARYLAAYEAAIHAIGRAADGRGVYAGPGISIKLSALHPRYQRAQYTRVMAELYPVLLRLARMARQYGIGLNIDAEEADRLELSLDLLERLCLAPELQGFEGIGFVVQAYQKRCPQVIDFVVDLARRSGHRIMVRLVKGAYWDSEIKRAQTDGLDGYPVYTRKDHTDVAYLACARQLLDAPDAVYPQFATHNAQTLAAVYQMADPESYRPGQYEFQCLHGMGEPLYEQVVGAQGLDRPCRIYAPVGTHETLLAYLVRRLLENGANTSFVHRMADPDTPIETLVQDPVATVVARAARGEPLGQPHTAIPAPADLLAPVRRNSAGLDLASDAVLWPLQQALQQAALEPVLATPLLALPSEHGGGTATPVRNPADHHDVVGTVREATLDDVQSAVAAAERYAADWAQRPPTERAACLDTAADAMQQALPQLLALLVREAGKTAANAVAEVREAIDFLRYYAAQVRDSFDHTQHVPLGPVVCISPWNFPLAIFTGQVAAALAAGNPVLAKPAEQTPLVAAEAVRLLWQAGVPAAALQLLPGRGETVGAALVADARVQGVMFTGSTEVARLLQRQLSQRLGRHGHPVPLIAETGGQNAMIVDSSALPEQVVQDVLASAFDSAGQRCSALRVLCLQEEAADHILAMLQGAMAELQLGHPARLAVDVGPVIDGEALGQIERHVAALRERGCKVYQAPAHALAAAQPHSTFAAPTLVEIDHLGVLEREVFGPVLHVLRYRRDQLDALLAQINGTGYALTLGLHTRIDETIARVTAQAKAGNLYVNRNMVGAVVGVQPFGGDGLSGTGPKAGGPLYLYRLLSARPANALAHAWAFTQGPSTPEAAANPAPAAPLTGHSLTLPGPTGERNTYRLQPREAVLCLAGHDSDRQAQLDAVRAVGTRAVWPASARAHWERLPAEAQQLVQLVDDWQAPHTRFDAVIHHGTETELTAVLAALAERPGPIVGVVSLRPGDAQIPLERLLVEHSLSVNTAAAGGNASLMTLA